MENRHSETVSRSIHTIPSNTDTVVYLKDIRGCFRGSGEEMMCVGVVHGHKI